MPRFAVLLAFLLLTGTVHAADDASLWQAAFALDEADKAAAAEATLLKGGAASYAVLVKLARATGDEQALALAVGQRPCPMFAMHLMGRQMGQSVLPEKVAKLALRVMTETPGLRQRAETSAEPFDRAMALVVASSVPDTFAASVERLRQEKEPWLLLWANSFVQCVLMRPLASREVSPALQDDARSLSERAQELRDAKACQEPSDLDEQWVEWLAGGTATASGWSRSGDELRVSARAGPGQSLEVGTGCAVAMYDAVAKRGKYLPGLLMPVATEQWVAMGARKAAGARAVKDLAQYPEHERNRLAAQLVNAGFDVPVKVSFSADSSFVQAVELEAAARQGHPGARAAILQAVYCRDSGREVVGLLGFVKGREAADTAYQLARKCPAARSTATAALVRLKDKRALELLGPALDDRGFGRDALQAALMQSLTPPVAAKLRALAEQKSTEAESLVRLLKAAQVMKD
jgi:hypothetical protein